MNIKIYMRKKKPQTNNLKHKNYTLVTLLNTGGESRPTTEKVREPFYCCSISLRRTSTRAFLVRQWR